MEKKNENNIGVAQWTDYVSCLNNYCNRNALPHPHYAIRNVTQAHAILSSFVCRATFLGQHYDGLPCTTKKEAKQKAAQTVCLALDTRRRAKEEEEEAVATTQPLLVVDLDNFPGFIEKIDTERLQRYTIYGFTSKPNNTSSSSSPCTGANIIRLHNEDATTKTVQTTMTLYVGALLASLDAPLDIVIVAGDKMATSLMAACRVPLCIGTRTVKPRTLTHCKRIDQLP